MNTSTPYLVEILRSPEYERLNQMIEHPTEGRWFNIPWTRKVCIEVKTDKASAPQRYPSLDPNNGYKPIWNSWLEACEAMATVGRFSNNLISTGYSSTHRSVLVVDVDEQFLDEGELNECCFNMGIPLPSYFTYNKKTGHCHVAWLIKDFSIHTELNRGAYVSLTKRMNRVFSNKLGIKCDESYNGDYTRNPYIFSQETSWVSTEEHDINEFLCLSEEDEEEEEVIVRKKVCVNDTDWIASDSRNDFCIRNIRRFFMMDLKSRGWFGLSNEFIRKHYTMEMLTELFINLEYISLTVTGKTEIEGMNEIRSSVKSAYSFTVLSYEQSKIIGNPVNSCNRDSSSANRYTNILDHTKYEKSCHKAIRYLKAMRLKEQGMKGKDIAVEVGMTHGSLRYLFSTYSTEQARETLLQFLEANREWMIKYKEFHYTDKYADLKEEVLDAVKEYFPTDEELTEYLPKVYNYELAYREGDKEAVWKLYMEEMQHFSSSPSSMRCRAL